MTSNRKPDEKWEGSAIYKDPVTSCVDSNAAPTYGPANYSVVAVNFAQMRSDDAMAAIRLWPHGFVPMRLSDSTGRLSDSVRVPLGALQVTQYGTGKAYKAVRYRPVSESGIVRGVHAQVVSNLPPVSSPRLVPVGAADHRLHVYVYDLSGARVASIPATLGTARAVTEAVRRLPLATGIYRSATPTARSA